MSDNTTEQHRLDEAFFGGLGVALVGKLIVLLTQKENIRKVLDALRSRRDELPEEATALVDGIEAAIEVVEENLPPTIVALTDAKGRWAPTNWAGNLLVAILSKIIRKEKAPAAQNMDATGDTNMNEHTLMNQIRKLVKEELEVVLTNEEANEMFNLDLSTLIDEMIAEEDDNWIQDAEKDIERRGTEGVCTGEKFGSESCPPGSKRYNLAKTFRKMAKKRKKA